ncbi:archease [Corallococcus praedator]|uniref:Archease n=1 Tax=Corallococcus praedator TaxID=2316724 RepID=A0ABX9Q5N0_9BACT|nr:MULTISPECIES: archease [Corallococcus]RKH11069.1 archease [Corallococcus sp. CA047B]RKH27975.1 archease [Corallococcus sp. CA031C]RKH90483.1 archease [Corallococcus praedator]
MDVEAVHSEEGRPHAHWEHFTRDEQLGVRGVGHSMEQAFELTAQALCALVTDPKRVEAHEELEVSCHSADHDQLLADWLSAVVGAMAARRLRFQCFAVRLDGLNLFGHGFGERAGVERHGANVAVTGATFTGVSVRQGPGGVWTAEALVDF